MAALNQFKLWMDYREAPSRFHPLVRSRDGQESLLLQPPKRLWFIYAKCSRVVKDNSGC